MGTTTPNLGLVKPTTGTQNWGSAVDNDLDRIDTAIGELQTGVSNATGAVPSVFGRSGAVTAQSGDYSFTEITGTVSTSQLPQIPVSQLNGTLAILSGGTGATTAQGARSNINAAGAGVNSDITALSAVTSLTISNSQAITGVQGQSGTKLLATKGAFTSTNLVSTDANGNAVDSGVSISSVQTAITGVQGAVTQAATAVLTAQGAETLAQQMQPVSQKGVPNGYASLDVNGLVIASQLPPMVINHTYVVASQAAMLALSANMGDVAVRTDNGITYILQGTTPGDPTNWVQLLAPGSGVVSVNGQTGAVTTLSGLSVATANGIGATVINPSTTPQISLSLGAITPSSVASTGAVSGSALSASTSLTLGSSSALVGASGTGTKVVTTASAAAQNHLPAFSSTGDLADSGLLGSRVDSTTSSLSALSGSLFLNYAGGNKVAFGDGNGNTVATVDSAGNAVFNGSLKVGGNGGILFPDITNGHIYCLQFSNGEFSITLFS